MGVPPVVARIDHVVVEAADEQALFDLLTGDLGLPVAWPVAQWGLIHEGGVGLGNCNLGCNHPFDPASAPGATVRALALEPAAPLADALASLERRGVAVTEPMPSGTIDVPDEPMFDPWRRGWHNALVHTAGMHPTAFVCDYDHDTAARRRQDRARLDTANGGRLGVTDLRQVVVHADDVDAAVEMWRPLLGDPHEHGTFSPGDGPQVSFRQGSEPPALLLGVGSIAAAGAALGRLGIGHSLDGTTGEVHLDPDDVGGLDLRLTDG